MDALTEVLRSVRLSGAVFLDARFSAPWCVRSHVGPEFARPAGPPPARLIGFHMVVAGEMLATVEGTAPARVRAGEIVLFPRNDAHELASAPGLRSVDAEGLIRPAPEGGLMRIDHGGGGARTRLICGFLAGDAMSGPLLANLPPLLALDVRRGVSGDWIDASLRIAAREFSGGRYSDAPVVARLSEILLIEAIRDYAATRGREAAGWLRGALDGRVGKALALIHRDARDAWSAEGLAREVAMSRSAFVERFTALVGAPPARYIQGWRLDLAARALRETQAPVARVAEDVGYASEEAFSRAFKRRFGQAPAHWRVAAG